MLKLRRRKPYFLVVRQLGGIGDVLTISCVLRGIAEKYPDHTIKVVTSRAYLSGCLLELFEHNPYVKHDDIIDINPLDGATDVTKKWWSSYAAASRLEDTVVYARADIAVDLNVACIEGEQAEIAKYGRVVTPRYKLWSDAAGVTPSSFTPIYEITNAERMEAAKFFRQRGWEEKKVVGVGIAAYSDARSAAKGKLHTVCHGLQALGYIPVTIDGMFQFNDVPALVGRRIKDLMPIIERMEAVISADSGILHMAGTVGTPVVGLFGTTDYKMRMGMYTGSAVDSTKLVPCAPCWYNQVCLTSPNPQDHYACMNMVGADIILEETRRWVEGDLSSYRPARLIPQRIEIGVLK